MKSASRTNDPPRKSRAKQPAAFLTGSGNVFADLGHTDPELALAKAELCSRLCDRVEAQKLTDAATGKLLGIDAPAVHDLLRGGFGPYTPDQLRGYVQRLDESLRPHDVFADLGFRNPDSTLAKAELVRKLRERMDESARSVAETARLLKIDESKFADLLRGMTVGFTFDRLFRFLNALGHEVVIDVRPVAGGGTPAETRVERH
jgi:predicted XRE-type DNA-binding protein